MRGPQRYTQSTGIPCLRKGPLSFRKLPFLDRGVLDSQVHRIVLPAAYRRWELERSRTCITCLPERLNDYYSPPPPATSAMTATVTATAHATANAAAHPLPCPNGCRLETRKGVTNAVEQPFLHIRISNVRHCAQPSCLPHLIYPAWLPPLTESSP